MNEIHIDAGRVTHVAKSVVLAVDQIAGRAHPIEVLLGVAEALGRIIAVQDGTYVVHNQLVQVATEQIKNTLRAAYSAKGDNPGAIA